MLAHRSNDAPETKVPQSSHATTYFTLELSTVKLEIASHSFSDCVRTLPRCCLAHVVPSEGDAHCDAPPQVNDCFVALPQKPLPSDMHSRRSL